MDVLEPGLKTVIAPRAGGRLAEIEVLRAIAVLMVLVEHMPVNLVFWHSGFADTYLVPSGLWDGVDLFFAISGFVIARALLPRLHGVTEPLKFLRIAMDFWIARAWRLIPSAWLWLTVPVILCVVFNKSNAYGSLEANWEMFVAGILDLANFHMAAVYGRYGSGTAFAQWSLSLEEQFYLVLPVAAFLCRRWLVVPLVLISLGGLVVSNIPLSFMVRLWPVAFGVLLALWEGRASYRELEPIGLNRRPVARAALLLLALACLITTGAGSLHIVSFYQEPIAVLAVTLVWLASYDQNYLWPPGLLRRGMEVIAARSYSLYLIHIDVYFGIHELWYRRHGLAIPTRLQAVEILLLAAVVLICVTELSHRLVEIPLRARGKQIVARRRLEHISKEAVLF